MKKIHLGMLSLLGLAMLVAPACSAGQTISQGQEFLLNPGKQAAITGEDLTVKFVGVTEDSRCPTGVT